MKNKHLTLSINLKFYFISNIYPPDSQESNGGANT